MDCCRPVASIFWNYTIKTAGVALATIYTNRVPVFALAAGAVLLGEAITPVQVAGGSLIVGGVLLARRQRR